MADASLAAALEHPASHIKGQVVSQEPKMVHFTGFVSREEVAHLLALAEGRWTPSKVTRGSASALLGKKGAGMGGPGSSLEEVTGMGAPGSTVEAASGDEEVGGMGMGGSASSHEEERSAGKEQGVVEPTDVQSEDCTSSMVMLGYEESPVVERVLGRVATVTGYPLEHAEQLLILRYTSGQRFNIHHDGAMRPMTVFTYLNDVAEGGETRFPHLGVQVKPAAGTAVMWRNTVGEGEDAEADRRMDHEALPPGEGLVKFGMVCFVNRRPQRDCSHIALRPAQGGA